MHKFLTKIFFSAFLSVTATFAQFGVGVLSLPPNEANEYAKPMATFLGSYFNSGTYYSADLPETFQFKFSIIGTYSLISDEQKLFTPSPGVEGYNASGTTSTFVGEKGSYYVGPGGFLSYPGGFNLSSALAAGYQIAGSFYSTELMLRFFPTTKFDNVELGLFGVGIKHSISQWIPTSPVDFAVQILFNNFNFEHLDDPEDYIKLDSKNIAINAHVSKTFQEMFIVYGGLQYESSDMDMTYYFRDPNELYPQIADTRQSTTVEGDNVFRFTAGGAIKLLPVVFNLDFNVTSMFTISGGLSLQL